MDISLRAKGIYAFGRFRLDPVRRVLLHDDATVPLTPKAFEVLLYLVSNSGRVVEKDELLNEVWAGRFVEESNVSQTIFTLRKALSGAGEESSLISTLSGRGYTFTAPVQLNSAAYLPDAEGATALRSAAPPPAARETSWLRPTLIVGMSVILIAIIAVFTGYRNTPPPRVQPRLLVLADFQNFTTDPALGSVMGKVLEIDLAQSPFLNLLSPQQQSETLRQMERLKDAKLTPDLAQEVCARNQGDAMLSGSVAKIGQHFLVTLQVRDCNHGGSIAEVKTAAASEDDLPDTLDGLTVSVREALKESSASIGRFNTPIAQATTSSFEALKAFSLGESVRANGDNAAALSSFKRATELDPSFALAYAELGSGYFGLRETELGKAAYRKAFDLKDRASENEKLRIAAVYYERLGNFTKAVQSYQLWVQTYPQDWLPWAHLANILTGTARYKEAVAAGREALRLNPLHYGPYSVLARAYKRSTRFAEAKEIGRLAAAKGFDGWDIHGVLYEVAFAEGDSGAMARQVAKETGTPTEPWMLDYEAWGAATAGQINQCRTLFEKAIRTAREQGPDSQEEATLFLEDYIESMAYFGFKQEAQKLALGATDLRGSEYGSFALAMAGNFADAASDADALRKRYPESTEVNDEDIPLVRATIDLGQGRPKEAVNVLQPSLASELRDFYTSSLLGEAYLDLHQPDKAAAEFQKILDNRGVDGLSPLYPLAYLGLARALRMEGKPLQSKAAFEKLFSFWKDADADLLVLQEARREYAQLQGPTRNVKR
jgi:DNA-binding winged helix-turn-helix (wHTH) protein/tetratricopeptide (TPR) repeat protein